MTFSQPGTGGDVFDIKTNGPGWLGALFIIWPMEVKPQFDTGKFDPTDVVVADIGIIDRIDPNTGKPTFFKDAFIFSKGLVANTKTKLGEIVLGRLVQRQFQQGVGWSLDPFTPQDAAMAEQYLATNPRTSFTAPAATTSPAPSAHASAPAAHDPWAGMNATPAPPLQYQSAPAAASPSMPTPPAPTAAPAVDPHLVAFLMSKGISNAATLDEATAKSIAAVYPDNPFK